MHTYIHTYMQLDSMQWWLKVPTCSNTHELWVYQSREPTYYSTVCLCELHRNDYRESRVVAARTGEGSRRWPISGSMTVFWN